MTRRKGSMALGLLAAVVAVSTAAADERRQGPEVASTLDHKRVLPQRIRWMVYAKPASRLVRVDFLIDGKLRWIEHSAPFTYGGDDSHGHLGYLITTWLAPGRHRFTTHAVTTSGRNGKRTIVARVVCGVLNTNRTKRKQRKRRKQRGRAATKRKAIAEARKGRNAEKNEGRRFRV